MGEMDQASRGDLVHEPGTERLSVRASLVGG